MQLAVLQQVLVLQRAAAFAAVVEPGTSVVAAAGTPVVGTLAFGPAFLGTDTDRTFVGNPFAAAVAASFVEGSPAVVVGAVQAAAEVVER